MAGGDFWTLFQAASPKPGCFPREEAKSFCCQWDAHTSPPCFNLGLVPIALPVEEEFNSEKNLLCSPAKVWHETQPKFPQHLNHLQWEFPQPRKGEQQQFHRVTRGTKQSNNLPPKTCAEIAGQAPFVKKKGRKKKKAAELLLEICILEVT